MNNITTSTNLNNNTFTVDEIDIDTKRPQVSQVTSNHFDFFVKQIKVKETLIGHNELESRYRTPRSVWNKTPTSRTSNSNIPLRIKQRVLTPYHQEIVNTEHRNLNNLNLSTIVSSGESRMIPEIVITEFFDENNNLIEDENKENMVSNCLVDCTEAKILTKKIKKNREPAQLKQPQKVRIKPVPCCPNKCNCCDRTIMKIGEDRLFVSNSVHANLAVDEFPSTTEKSKNFDDDSLGYLEPRKHNECSILHNKISTEIKNSYDNDYYLMNEFVTKEKPELKDETLKSENSKKFEYFYFYCSAEKYLEISEKRQINLEPMIINGELKNALTLLSLPPESSDLSILNELFEKNTPIDLKRVESYIMIRRDHIEKHAQHLVQVNENKFLFKRAIILEGKFPKNWLKSPTT